MIEISHLRKEYGDAVPLKDVNTVINDGEVIAIIGPSGTGKSTLLRCLNLLEKPTSGSIKVDGVEITDKNCDISKLRMKMGMVFQSFNLFGHMTVIENLMYAPCKLLHKSRQEAYDTGMHLLRAVGLSGKALSYPDQLSGGQKQRIAIARTLAMDPDIILFDEPTSALDPTMVGEVEAVIKELSKGDKTLLIVTHEMRFARQVSSRIFYMDEGGIYEDGTPEQIFENPQKENTRRFIKKLKVLEFELTGVNNDYVGMFSDITRFCMKNQISPVLKNKIISVIEELCFTIILPKLRNIDMKISIEVSEPGDEAVIKMSYPDAFDPATTDDDISLKIVKARTESIKYIRQNDRSIVKVVVNYE